MLARSFGKRISGTAFAGAIEADDASVGVQHDHQRAHRIENRGDHVAFPFQGFFRPLQVGDIETDTMNEPRAAIVSPDHLGFAVKPDHTPIAGQHAVCRTQRFAAEEQLSGFHAPALFVVGMDLRIPANRILQPLFLRETEHGFDLRTDVGFADRLVEIGHEHDCGNLLDQGAVLRLQVGQREIQSLGAVV